MSHPGSSHESNGASGFTQQYKVAIAVLSAALHTRLNLFVTELEEERERLKHTAILLVLAISGAGFGFILLNIFIVALFWERGWITAIGLLALVYFAVAAAAVLKLRNEILQRTGLFPATLAELAKDRDHLKAAARE